jgi:RND family efflux transporter MFP subunit
MNTDAGAMTPRKNNRRAHAVISITLLGLIITGALFTVQMQRRTEAAPAKGADDVPTVSVITATRGKGKAELLLPATVQARQEATLYARTNGYVRRWSVDIGDKVREGQLLAEIETPELDREVQEAQAKLVQAQAHLTLARSTAERYQALLKDQAVTPQEVDEKTGGLEVRVADVKTAEAHLRRLEQMRAFQKVTAPFSGTITARNIEKGTLVNAGAGDGRWLFRLQQTDTLRLFVSLPQNYLPLVKQGTEADILVREVPDKTFAAKVERHAGALDPATRTLLLELHMDNRAGQLLPGIYAQARFRLVNANPPIVLPIATLLIGGDGGRVATVDKDNTVRLHKVELGRDLGKEVEILQGVAENERIIVNPKDTAADGMRVNPVVAESEKHHEKGGDKPKPVDKPADKPAAKS